MWLDASDNDIPSPTAGTAAGSTGPVCGVHCGTERWEVKTLSDPDTGRIHGDTVDASVEDLVALERPNQLSASGRADPVEVTIYRVKARLVWFVGEKDGDYHLVLASLPDPAIQMIAEVPNPGCTGSCASGRSELYARVRQTLMDHLDSPQSEAAPVVRVTGVGFFDYLHGQRGVAPNGIELHPVIKVEFP
ncbi:MAG TPA: hypothetical protein VG454_14880 [Gemmatimonadales bacterium]|nr:hypothetical protein [Gemmatimonadales bacterium]